MTSSFLVGSTLDFLLFRLGMRSQKHKDTISISLSLAFICIYRSAGGSHYDSEFIFTILDKLPNKQFPWKMAYFCHPLRMGKYFNFYLIASHFHVVHVLINKLIKGDHSELVALSWRFKQNIFNYIICVTPLQSARIYFVV